MLDAHADRLQARGDYDRAGGGNATRCNLVGQLAHDVGLIIVRNQNTLVRTGGVLEN